MRIFLFCCFAFFSCTTADQLHRKAIVVDTHNDVLSTVSMRGLAMDADLRGKTHSDIHRFQQGGVDIQVFSVFCDERFGKDTAFKYANLEIDSLNAVIRRNGNRMMLVTSPNDLAKAVKEKKLGCMIGVEGGHMIEDRLDYLNALYNRGARYLTLTWNNSTSWATSAWYETDPSRLKQKANPHSSDENSLLSAPQARPLGLTDFGKQVVQRMNALGMMVDVSHLGEKSFWDVMETTTKPIIASHSCAYSLCAVPRNLKDEQIKAIAKNGGVIHLNFYSGFLDSTYAKKKTAFLSKHSGEVDSLKKTGMANWEIEEWISEKYKQEANSLRPPLSLLIDHIDYIVKLAGIDHVGLGSDFDGIESSPLQLDDVAALPALTKALRERGYSNRSIKKILGTNFIRVFRANQTTTN